MFRKTRTMAPLLGTFVLRAIVLPVASVTPQAAAPIVAVSAVALSASLLTACGYDESQPEYWIEKLPDRKYRKKAVEKLIQFYENSHQKADSLKDATKAEEKEKLAKAKENEKAVVEKAIGPLTDTYIKGYGELDLKTRGELIKFLASLQDKRADKALEKAFEEYNKKPPTPNTDPEDQDLKNVLRAVKEMKAEQFAPQLIEAAFKTDPNYPVGRVMFNEMREPVKALARTAAGKAWVPVLKKQLEAQFPVLEEPEDPAQKNTPAYKAKFRDHLEALKRLANWQELACFALGEIGDASAVPDLMRVVLDPAKGPIALQASLALVQLGKPAMEAAVKLLQDQDEVMGKFHIQRLMAAKKMKEPPKDKPYIQLAASILGTLGRVDAIEPMVAVIKANEKDKKVQVLVAAELAKLPLTPESKAAFIGVFDSIDTKTKVDDNLAASILGSSVTGFYDSSFVEYLIGRFDKLKGDQQDLQEVHQVFLESLIKLAQPAQLDAVEAAHKKWVEADKLPRDQRVELQKALGQARAVTKKCGDKVDCYVTELQASENQMPKVSAQKGEKPKDDAPIVIDEKDVQSGAFVGMKAALQVATIGKEADRDKLVKALSNITGPNVRALTAVAIDKLSPNGGKDIADQLDAIVTKNEKSGDEALIAADGSLKQVVYRLRARGGK